jgi:hypothetical protein
VPLGKLTGGSSPRASTLQTRRGFLLTDRSGMEISPGRVLASGDERKTVCDGETQAPVFGNGGRELQGMESAGFCETGATRRRQARRAVTVAQNTVEWRRYEQKRRLGFSSVFTKIPHEGSPIYRGFAPRSCATRIHVRRYLQSKFELSFGWDLVDFRLGKKGSCLVKSPRGRRVGLVLATRA